MTKPGFMLYNKYMQHRLSNVDELNMYADCRVCGRIPVVYRPSRNRWICRIAKGQYLKGGGKKPIKSPSNCDICDSSYVISYDHDHATGRHRGWLCMHCNTALGLVKDDPITLQKMIDYLAK